MKYVKTWREGTKAVELILFAWTFIIPFNVEPLKQYLDQRKQFGGLNEHELLAQGLLFERSMSPRDLVIYLEQHGTRLKRSDVSDSRDHYACRGTGKRWPDCKGTHIGR